MDAVVAEYPSLLSKFAIMHSNKDYGTKNKNSVQKCSKKHSLPLQVLPLGFLTNVLKFNSFAKTLIQKFVEFLWNFLKMFPGSSRNGT